jgi:radical SAM protein with 4Fe4S-binding SPASM domain
LGHGAVNTKNQDKLQDEIIRSSFENFINDHILRNVQIELLTRCNWVCKHCYNADRNNDGLPMTMIRRLLYDLRSMGTFEIEFTGGEPFLRKDFIDIVELSRNLGFNVLILSNLSIITLNEIDKIKELNVQKISSTIFSMNQVKHDFITGRQGSLNEALNSILIMRNKGISLEIKTVITRFTLTDYREVHEFCKQHQISHLITTNIFPKRNGYQVQDECSVDVKDLYGILPEIDKYRNFDKPRGITSDSYMCNSIHYSLHINSSGDVYPCIMMPIAIGNINHKNIFDIWNNSEKLKEISSFTWNYLHKCSSCKSKQFCYRCAGLAYLHRGTFYAEDILECKNAEIRHAIFGQQNIIKKEVEKLHD